MPSEQIIRSTNHVFFPQLQSSNKNKPCLTARTATSPTTRVSGAAMARPKRTRLAFAVAAAAVVAVAAPVTTITLKKEIQHIT